MKTEVTPGNYERTTVTRLREATRGLHVSLHEHPLIFELLTRPSIDSYRAVLEGFLRFYETAEPAVVQCSHRFGVAELYPRPDRMDWLSADLETLDCVHQRIIDPAKEGQTLAPMTGIAELAGWLYVIRGSALGGRTILRQVRRGLDVNRCCRFLNGDGGRTAQVWEHFQQFCNDACRCEETRQAAIGSARNAFLSVAESLTWSMKQSQRLE